MRQFGEIPPWLAAQNTPAVGACTGLGTGGGAAVQTPDSGGFGTVEVAIGTNAPAAGSIALVFPSTPPTLFVAPNADGFGAISQATVSNTVTISWTAASWPAGGSGSKRHKISYEWLVSQ